MLNKEELNYLAMLVVLDQRAVFKEFRNNNQGLPGAILFYRLPVISDSFYL